MKTAIQSLIESWEIQLQATKDQDIIGMLQAQMNRIKAELPNEQKQIEQAYNNGALCDMNIKENEDGSTTRVHLSASDYFTTTYTDNAKINGIDHKAEVMKVCEDAIEYKAYYPESGDWVIIISTGIEISCARYSDTAWKNAYDNLVNQDKIKN